MKVVALLVFALLGLACAQLRGRWNADLLEPMVRPEMIQTINSMQNLWTAGENRFSTMTRAEARKLLGYRRDPAVPPKESIRAVPSNDPLPNFFDAREQWPMCASLRDIRDQGGCGDCWAFGAIEPITDRTCIWNEGRINPKLSASDLLSCCSYCGGGCEVGGSPSQAHRYWVETGLVTGGEYHTKEGCMPYAIQCCGHHGASHPECRPSCQPHEVAPNCTFSCIPESHEDFNRDKHHGASWHYVSGAKQMMEEIMQHGPIEASFSVYTDFFSYRGGVYYHTWGKLEGGHSVKLVGWGREPDTDNGTAYWIVANSWNDGWADHGFFKMRRGTNECELEDQEVVAAVPVVEPVPPM